MVAPPRWPRNRITSSASPTTSTCIHTMLFAALRRPDDGGLTTVYFAPLTITHAARGHPPSWGTMRQFLSFASKRRSPVERCGNSLPGPSGLIRLRRPLIWRTPAPAGSLPTRQNQPNRGLIVGQSRPPRPYGTLPALRVSSVRKWTGRRV